MQEIMASFFIECEELHESLVDALQALADGDADVETINVAFRAVHSIKGGAGAFGLDDLVNFAHQFETVMDACRSGDLAMDDPLNSLFLRCSDVLSDLIRCSRDGEPIDTAMSGGLIEELAAYVSSDNEGGAEPEEEIDFQPMTLDLGELGGPGDDMAVDLPSLDDLPPINLDFPSTSPGLLVEFRPDRELYESGNEPLFLIKTLADLGPCQTTVTLDPPKSIEDLKNLGGRLSWSILVETVSQPDAVAEIFEFTDGLCQLNVTPQQDAEPDAVISELTEETTPVVTPQADDIPTAAPPAPAETSKANPIDSPSTKRSESKPAKASPTVRVDLERIERLVNLVGELVINQAMLSQSIAQEDIPPNSPVSAGLDEFMQLTRNIQESVMMIRAQPVKSLFQRMSRIVRESSAAIDKRVRLVTDGETTEIDKTAIERLADPLTHMIRNAVDHGLENAATRRERGKNEQGEIRLSAAHRSGRVVIEVADDGGGIDREKVRAKAIEKGLIAEDAALSESETDQLLFLPGFSTATEVSSLSGRGVGMDVVRTQISSLGGRVSIESSPGVGTTFSISLPLTLAVLDGMVITVAGETLVIPLNAIVETLSLAVDDLRTVAEGQKVLRVREQFVSVLDLGTELGYRAQIPVEEGTIALLISPEEGVLVALLVDTIEDQRQVVIKGMQESYGRVPGVAAATILGDGQIALILDPNDLIQNSSGDDVVILQKKAS
ncbi:MAG: chemotaxis protein CheA [Silicimonas sp.]|nr:chemotaxis protein CheA [Silicimonas sp.]